MRAAAISAWRWRSFEAQRRGGHHGLTGLGAAGMDGCDGRESGGNGSKLGSGSGSNSFGEYGKEAAAVREKGSSLLCGVVVSLQRRRTNRATASMLGGAGETREIGEEDGAEIVLERGRDGERREGTTMVVVTAA
ncbi:hypothetical protein M0R45_001387 [Rubus argutus]|uniref:Uncharacterized protein n=1 Tax=Rubus argutus TaxID=59490 RepID=A0AAW1VMF6_RUBAR